MAESYSYTSMTKVAMSPMTITAVPTSMDIGMRVMESLTQKKKKVFIRLNCFFPQPPMAMS